MDHPSLVTPQDLSPAEEKIATRAAKKKKLFVLLRAIRTELFDPSFQEELAGMYRQTGAGKPPVPPALLAMATRLQAYTGVGDQEAVEVTLDSKRWQLVLGGLGAEEPLFSQGARFDLRMRLLSTGMDQRWLERTVELARARAGLDAKALRLALDSSPLWGHGQNPNFPVAQPQQLALDSSPLWGHGRVEDTFTLLGHAAHPVIACLAELTQHEVTHVMERIGLSLFDAPSRKAALAIDGGDAEQKPQALQRLCDALDALQRGIGEHLPLEQKQPPLAAALDTLHALLAQDLEPDPTGGGVRLREGVAKDRRISIRGRDHL